MAAGIPNGIFDAYPLVMTDSLLLEMAIEIVDLPINSMVIFHSFLYVYQRVYNGYRMTGIC